MKEKKRDQQSGQVLVVLLVFIAVATTVGIATTLLSAYSLSSASDAELAQTALDTAESGMENALLRLLRNPSYTGETLTLPTGVVTITVTGASTKTITATATAGGYLRSVVVQTSTTDGVTTVNSWRDQF